MINKIGLIIYNVNLRIEIHILSLHWMMKNIAILMFPRSPLGFTVIKIANVFHHPVQAEIMIFNLN